MSEVPSGVPHEQNTSLPRREISLGQQDFEAAIDVAAKMSEPGTRNDLQLTISMEQARAGLDPLYPPERFLNLLYLQTDLGGVSPIERISLMQAYIGDSIGAMETAANKGNNTRSSLGLARILAAKGVDVLPILTRVTQEIMVENHRGLSRIGMLTETQRELGFEPDRSLIDQFRENPYRSIGDRSSHSMSLASAYAGAGFPEDAFEAWKDISETYPKYFRANSLVAVAEAHARCGLDSSHMLLRAQELAEAIEPQGPYKQIPGADRARVYARIARVQHISGGDPHPTIDGALAHAATEPTNIRTNALVVIAKAQISFGHNARETLIAAREWTRGIVKPDDPPGSWGSAIQIGDWEDVFRMQLEGGYLTDARETLEEYNKYPEEEIIDYTAGLRASLARAHLLVS